MQKLSSRPINAAWHLPPLPPTRGMQLQARAQVRYLLEHVSYRLIRSFSDTGTAELRRCRVAGMRSLQQSVVGGASRHWRALRPRSSPALLDLRCLISYLTALCANHCRLRRAWAPGSAVGGASGCCVVGGGGAPGVNAPLQV